MTREFKVGDELLPGVVVVRLMANGETKVSFVEGIYPTSLNIREAEHLASIGDRLRELEAELGQWEPGVLRMKVDELTTEIERLNAICPTEWRTGIPDWDSLDPEATIEWIDQKYSPNHSSCEFVKNFLTGGDDEDGWEGYIHRIIPYVPPPKPERVYTEADLPKVEGCKWEIYEDPSLCQISYDNDRVFFKFHGATKSDTIRVAREWFKRIQAAEVPE